MMSYAANLRDSLRESKRPKWDFKSFEQLLGDPNDFLHLQRCQSLVESLKSQNCCFALETLFDAPLHYHERFNNFIRFGRLQDYFDLEGTLEGHCNLQEALVAAQFDRMRREMIKNGIEMSIIY